MRLRSLPVTIISRAYSFGAVISLGVVLLATSLTALLLVRDWDTESAAQAAPELAFEDARGRTLSLADFRGQIVLLNVWATWCAPCRKEMPALDRLQAKLGPSDFRVVALSLDRGGASRVQPFFAEIAIQNLPIYLDRNSDAMAALGVTGLPTTVLLGRDGQEIRRWIGPAEWDSPEIIALIEAQLSPHSDPS